MPVAALNPTLDFYKKQFTCRATAGDQNKLLSLIVENLFNHKLALIQETFRTGVDQHLKIDFNNTLGLQTGHHTPQRRRQYQKKSSYR